MPKAAPIALATNPPSAVVTSSATIAQVTKPLSIPSARTGARAAADATQPPTKPLAAMVQSVHTTIQMPRPLAAPVEAGAALNPTAAPNETNSSCNPMVTSAPAMVARAPTAEVAPTSECLANSTSLHFVPSIGSLLTGSPAATAVRKESARRASPTGRNRGRARSRLLDFALDACIARRLRAHPTHRGRWNGRGVPGPQSGTGGVREARGGQAHPAAPRA